MSDTNLPARFECLFDWPRLLILHALVSAGVLVLFPAPGNFILAAGFMALFALRWYFFRKAAVVLEGDRATFQPLGHRFTGPVKHVSVRGAGKNIFVGGWLTVDLKGFGRRRVTIFPLLDPYVTGATLKAAAMHFQAVDRGEIEPDGDTR